MAITDQISKTKGEGTCDLMYQKHSPDIKKRVPQLRAPTGLHGVEERYLPKDNWGAVLRKEEMVSKPKQQMSTIDITLMSEFFPHA